MSIEKLKENMALLNNCVDDDEAILYQREIDNDTMVCGLCRYYDDLYNNCIPHLHYDRFLGYCIPHPGYGEVCEQDTCDDYEELP